MVTRKNADVAIVSESGANAALRRGAAKSLAGDEEKVLRMRLGASPPRSAPLERSFVPLSDAEIEVRAAEIEAWMRWKARFAARDPRSSAPLPRASRAKEKIIRALRKKS